jgi:hypothetical protein
MSSEAPSVSNLRTASAISAQAAALAAAAKLLAADDERRGSSPPGRDKAVIPALCAVIAVAAHPGAIA